MIMLKKIIFTFIIYHLFSTITYSDAWLQKKNKGLFITTIATQQFNSLSANGTYNHNNKVYQNLLLLYSEYGLTNRLTLGAKVIALDSFLLNGKSMFKNSVKDRTFGLDTADLFLRIGIIRNHKYVVLSLVTLFSFPSIEHNRPKISYFSLKKYAYEARLEFGLKFNKSNYATITTGYHRYINNWYDEARLEMLYCHYFLENLYMMARFQKIFYIITNKNTAARGYNALNNSVFDFFSKTGFAKFTLSFATTITKHTALEFGFYATVKSKLLRTSQLDLNLYGIFTSFWYQF